MEKIGDRFLMLCKQNYLNEITPATNTRRDKLGYRNLVDIAKEYFRKNEYNEFAGFFQEGQYFISLWAAHLLLEYGEPSKELSAKALNIIETYSNNPLAPEVAKEEAEWLVKNIGKYD